MQVQKIWVWHTVAAVADAVAGCVCAVPWRGKIWVGVPSIARRTRASSFASIANFQMAGCSAAGACYVRRFKLVAALLLLFRSSGGLEASAGWYGMSGRAYKRHRWPAAAATSRSPVPPACSVGASAAARPASGSLVQCLKDNEVDVITGAQFPTYLDASQVGALGPALAVPMAVPLTRQIFAFFKKASMHLSLAHCRPLASCSGTGRQPSPTPTTRSKFRRPSSAPPSSMRRCTRAAAATATRVRGGEGWFGITSCAGAQLQALQQRMAWVDTATCRANLSAHNLGGMCWI